jgi:hypothetical protein
MKRVFLLVLGWICLSSTGLAEHFYWFKTSTQAWKSRTDFLEGRLAGSLLDSLDQIYSDLPMKYIVFGDEETLFVHVPCTFDLYEIKGQSLVNLYQYFNKGYTCGTHAFRRDGDQFFIGGHGFWQQHLDLMTFDPFHGSWEIVPTAQQPRDYYSALVYQNSQGIYSLFGEEFNQRYGSEIKYATGYFLDWKNKRWQEIQLQIEGVSIQDLKADTNRFFIQTQDYVFLVSTSTLPNLGWNIIEKETGKIYYFDSKNIDMGESPYLEIVGNVLTYPAPNGQVMTLDLDQIRAKSKEVGLITIKEASFFKSNYFIYLLLFFLVIGVGGVFGRKIFVKRKKIKRDSSVELTSLQILLPYAGQLLTTETLDELLGIDERVNFDSRRMKRARLINELNKLYLTQAGKKLILREKNPEDRRFMRYKIQA